MGLRLQNRFLGLNEELKSRRKSYWHNTFISHSPNSGVEVEVEVKVEVTKQVLRIIMKS